MPRKEWKLLARDLHFYTSGKADVSKAAWEHDPHLYPLDWGYQLDRPDDYFSPFDEIGVPMRELPGGLGLTYLPSRIAGYAFANWNRWREHPNDERYRDQFFVAADWFLRQPDGLYRHEFELIGMDKAWLSCLAQGEALSVLTRAFDVTGDQKYRKQCDAAIMPLFTNVTDGGLQDEMPDGSVFLEEYPGTIYRHVLNGCLYALVGLRDYCAAGMDQTGKAKQLLDAVLDGIEVNLAGWETDGWTSYDYLPENAKKAGVRGNPNTMTYQMLHWILMEYLGERQNRTVLAKTADSWRTAMHSPAKRLQALWGKVSFRLGHGYRR